jgi:hypothetical protein
MGGARNSPGLDASCAFGLHLAKGHLGLMLIVKTSSVNHNGDFLSSLQQSEGSGLNGALDACSYDDEFVGPQLTEQAFYSRLVKGVDAAFVHDYLVVPVQQVRGQVCIAVGGEVDAIVQKCVTYLPLTVGAVYAIVETVTITIAVAVTITVARTNFANGDDGYVSGPGPGHYSSNPAENPSMVSDAGFTIGKEQILLRVDVNQHIPAFSSEQLPYHCCTFLETPYNRPPFFLTHRPAGAQPVIEPQ